MNDNKQMATESIPKLLFKLATPAIIAQIVNVLYTIVDRIFIGRMDNGEMAMAGVGVAFPIILIINAFSSLVGMGGAPLVAIKTGEKNNDEAEKIMSTAFVMLIGLAVILTAGIFIFKEDLLWMFGASNETIGYSVDYLSIYSIGTVFVMISLGMNPYINTQGFAKIGMLTVAIGAVTNIVLDPIFIFGFDMGVKGAALATIISQGVSAAWALSFLFGKKTILKIRKQYTKLDKTIVKTIVSLGIANFIMQSTESLVLISLNTKLQMYGGDLAVGAMTIMSSIMQIVLLPTAGLTQGSQPIISYNYGANNMDRVRSTFKLTLKLAFLYTAIMWLALQTLPEVFVQVFNDDPALMEITTWSIKIYFGFTFMFGIQVACQSTLVSLGQAKISLFLALLRKVILLVPLIYILPSLPFMEDKLFSVLLAQPIADFLAVSITAVTFMKFYKTKLGNKKVEEKQISLNH